MINPQQNCSTTSKADEQIINNIPVVPSSSSEESTKTHHSEDGQQHHHHHYHYHHQQVDDLKLLQADQSSTHSVEVITKQEGEPAVKKLSTDSIVSSAVRSPPADLSGREKLKRHRIEVAGRVWIPDLWGQEEFLKDWIDCSAFDSSLFPNGIMSARAALVEEGRRANSRIGNRCS